MKKRKSIIRIALCLCICLMMTGCGKGENSADATDSTGSTQKETTKNESSGNSGTENTSDGEEAASWQEEHPYWLTEEKGTLTVWQEWSNDYLESLNDMESMKVMDELTNVDVTYTNVGQQEASEKYGLLLASGDLPDIIVHSTVSYPGGMETGVEDGVYLDLADYIENLMPNYKAIRESDEEIMRDTGSDTGIIPAVYMIRANEYGEIQEEFPWAGLAIRQDWLDDLGLEVPETIDEWETVLSAFKEQKGAEAPLLIGPTANYAYDSFLSAYGVLSSFYLDDDLVKFGPAQEGYLEWLKTMRDWYQKGLINPNFMSAMMDFVVADESYLATGKSGAGHTITGFLGDAYKERGTATDENFSLSPVKNPVLNKGEIAQARCNDSTKVSGTAACVTTKCKTPELAVKWLDFHYTKKGMELTSYGIEGDTFEVVDGKYTFTDKITNDPEMSQQDMSNQYSMGDGIGLISWGRSSSGQEARAFMSVWTQDETSLQLPKMMTLTEEEGYIYNSYYTAIQTAVQEYTLNFILGTNDENGYSSYVDSLSGMGLDECMKCQQDAYDRYIAR